MDASALTDEKTDSDNTIGSYLAALPADIGALIIQAAATLDFPSAYNWITVSKAFKYLFVSRSHH